MDLLRMQSRRNGEGSFSDVLRRNALRKEISGFAGDITDGAAVYAGDVVDISSGGFRMSGVSGSFKALDHTYTVILSGDGNHYRLFVKACWTKSDGSGEVEVGFKVLDAPWEWVDFTLDENLGFDENAEALFHA